MKKAVVFLVVFLFSTVAYSADGCLNRAKKLQALQNRIVEKSLRKLPRGAWADYGIAKVVYLGRQVSPKSGKRLEVIEVSGKVTGQLWYKIAPHAFPYQGKRLKFWVPEPVEAYMKMGGMFLYLTREMVGIFLQGSPWGAYLKDGFAFAPPGCGDLPSVKKITRTLPGGKKVEAYVLRSKKYGGAVTCSPRVPFGLIQAVSTKDKTEIRLVKYGWKGGKGVISKNTLTGAVAITYSINKKKEGAKGGK